ncbi:MAG: hypothetical protein JST16_09625 [Bdellovibrionales bacterium]|nr:hypothetical protein [Bdellovibrionales bacterium]
MITSVCLAFLSTTGHAPAHLPAQVVAQTQATVRKQFTEQHPDVEIKFDAPDCPLHGTYEYTTETLVLESSADLWPGRREYSLTDLLDGKKLEFSAAPLGTAPRDPLATWKAEESTRPLARFAAGSVAGALVGGLGGLALSPDEANRSINGIVFALTGALAGGFLNLTW